MCCTDRVLQPEICLRGPLAAQPADLAGCLAAAGVFRYIDIQMACPDEETDEPAYMTNDGLRNTTLKSLDLYQLGLAVVQLYAGRMPQQLDHSRYTNLPDYLSAVFNFSWAHSAEVAAMPEAMRSWVLAVLAPNPQDRPTLAQALAHPWIRPALQRMAHKLEAAAPAWELMVQQLKDTVYSVGSAFNSYQQQKKKKKQEDHSFQQHSSVDYSSCSSSSNSSSSSVLMPGTPTGRVSDEQKASTATSSSRRSSGSRRSSSSGSTAQCAACASAAVAPTGVVDAATAPSVADVAAASAGEPIHLMLLVIKPEPKPVSTIHKETVEVGIQADVTASHCQYDSSQQHQQQQEEDEEDVAAVKVHVGCFPRLFKQQHTGGATNITHSSRGSRRTAVVRGCRRLGARVAGAVGRMLQRFM